MKRIDRVVCYWILVLTRWLSRRRFSTSEGAVRVWRFDVGTVPIERDPATGALESRAYVALRVAFGDPGASATDWARFSPVLQTVMGIDQAQILGQAITAKSAKQEARYMILQQESERR